MSILKINSQYKVYFVNYENCFVGIKKFILEKDGLYTNYFIKEGNVYKKMKYKFLIKKNFYGLKTNYEFIVSKKSNHTRYLYFEIPFYFKNEYNKYETKTEIKGGYQVFCYDTTKITIIREKVLKPIIAINIPVIFGIDAINFYDGSSALVNRFAFIPPDIFKQLEFPKKIRNLKAYDYYYNWIKEEIIK